MELSVSNFRLLSTSLLDRKDFLKFPTNRYTMTLLNCYTILGQDRYGGIRRSSASPCPPCDCTPTASDIPMTFLHNPLNQGSIFVFFPNLIHIFFEIQTFGRHLHTIFSYIFSSQNKTSGNSFIFHLNLVYLFLVEIHLFFSCRPRWPRLQRPSFCRTGWITFDEDGLAAATKHPTGEKRLFFRKK